MRKSALLTLFAFSLCHLLSAQITTDPGTGNVGIKTTSPEVPLHVNGQARFSSSGWFGRNGNGSLTNALLLGQNNAWDAPSVILSTQDVNGWGYSYWTANRQGHTFIMKHQSAAGGEKKISQISGGDGGHNIILYSAGDGETAKIQLNADAGSYFAESIGIGTNDPNSKLHLHTTNAYDGMRITHSGGGIIRFQSNSLPALAWNDITKEGDAGIIFGDHSGQNNVNFGFVLAPWRGGASGLRVDKSGAVSIATNQVDASSKLLVNGTIRARKVKVDSDTWADFVFEQNYPLPSLAEVSAFISQHKHLPGIPSAEEVKQKGIDLGDNQVALLQKIEELTLYIIDQQKQIDELKKKNEAFTLLAKEVEELKKAIAGKN